jgi:hypothetical protein
MDRLERIVGLLTAIIVLAVIGFAAVGPLRSAISAERVREDSRRENPHSRVLEAGEEARRLGHPVVPPAVTRDESATPPAPDPVLDPPAPPAPSRSRVGAKIAPLPTQPAPPANRPIVTEAVVIPPSALEKYRCFDDLLDLGRSARGADLPYQGGTAFRIDAIDDDSPLAVSLGFQAGDIVIAVNGRAVSTAAGPALYEALKDERRFEVDLERAGRRITIPYVIR